MLESCDNHARSEKRKEKGSTAIAVATCGRHGDQGRKMGGLNLPKWLGEIILIFL
jgi:hypothetical protein